MKVLLLQPNYGGHIIIPPFNLGYLASSLRKNNHEVELFDGTLQNADLSDYVKAVKKADPELIGVTMMCRAHHQVKKIVSKLKERFRIPIVIGGPHVSALTNFVLKDTKADFAVFGEGEITLNELLEHLDKRNSNYEKIEGLAYWKNGRISKNPPRELIQDISAIPFPAWDLMPPKQYRIIPILVKSKGRVIAPIMTTRGCPYHCTFCASNVTWKHRIRMRSAKNVVDEIEMLMNEYGVDEVQFSDDNFTMVREHAMAVCNEIIKRKIKISWSCPNGVRVDSLDRELLMKMKRAGCYALGFGIESGNQQILNSIKKSLDLEKVSEKLKLAKDIGMITYGFFILGFPEDTHDTIRQTIKFSKNKHLDYAWFNILAPYPGSEIFHRFYSEKDIPNMDWDSLDCSTAVIENTELTKEDLVSYQRKAALSFYFAPRRLLNLLANTSVPQIKSLLMTRFFENLVKKKKRGLG